jgi:eukaryotic-like serine/threonine-protein kinase
MATVYVGKLYGPEGFQRTVAIKRPHSHLVRDPEFAAMFLDEARLAARVRHMNVVPTLDVIDEGGEIAHVMEYVEGASLAELARFATESGQKPPLAIVARVVADVLEGLHAAHETKDERGQPLGIVHRDVSPQNVLVGVDGLSRVVDFGVAKAAGQQHHTATGRIKGKLAYVAPEYLGGQPADRRSDLYSAAIIFWELATGQWLFAGQTEQETLSNVLMQPPRPLGASRPDAPLALSAAVDRAIAREPERRYQDARSFARELKAAIELASHDDVGAWVRSLAAEMLAANAAIVERAEAAFAAMQPTLAAPPAAKTDPPPASLQPEAAAPSSAAVPFLIADGPSRGLTLRGLASPHGQTQSHKRPAPAPKLLLFFCGLAASIALGAGLAHLWQGRALARESLASTLPKAPLPAASAPAPEVPAPAESKTAQAPPAAKPDADDAPPAAASVAAIQAPSAPSPPRAAAPSPPRAAAPSPPPAAKRPGPKPKKREGSNASCDPPYTYDAAGIRHIKPQCI